MVEMTQRRMIRMFPDWGHEWPLWEDSTATYDYGYTMCPNDYSLSSGLSQKLRDWYDYWEAHDDPERGWDSKDRRRDWFVEGEKIADELGHEVRHFADVAYEVRPI